MWCVRCCLLPWCGGYIVVQGGKSEGIEMYSSGIVMIIVVCWRVLFFTKAIYWYIITFVTMRYHICCLWVRYY